MLFFTVIAFGSTIASTQNAATQAIGIDAIASRIQDFQQPPGSYNRNIKEYYHAAAESIRECDWMGPSYYMFDLQYTNIPDAQVRVYQDPSQNAVTFGRPHNVRAIYDAHGADGNGNFQRGEDYVGRHRQLCREKLTNVNCLLLKTLGNCNVSVDNYNDEGFRILFHPQFRSMNLYIFVFDTCEDRDSFIKDLARGGLRWDYTRIENGTKARFEPKMSSLAWQLRLKEPPSVAEGKRIDAERKRAKIAERKRAEEAARIPKVRATALKDTNQFLHASLTRLESCVRQAQETLEAGRREADALRASIHEASADELCATLLSAEAQINASEPLAAGELPDELDQLDRAMRASRRSLGYKEPPSKEQVEAARLVDTLKAQVAEAEAAPVSDEITPEIIRDCIQSLKVQLRNAEQDVEAKKI